MKLDWAADAIGLPSEPKPTVTKPTVSRSNSSKPVSVTHVSESRYKDTPIQSRQSKQVSGLLTPLNTSEVRAASYKGVDPLAGSDSGSDTEEDPAAEEKALEYLRKKRGAETLGSNPMQSVVYECPSPTEVASDDEEFTRRYLPGNSKAPPERPVQTVFGPGYEVIHSFGGRIHAKQIATPPRTSTARAPQTKASYLDRKNAVPAPKVFGSLPDDHPVQVPEADALSSLPILNLGQPVDSGKSFDDGQVHYPTLPSIASFDSEPPLYAHPAPENVPPPETPTPAGYLPSYRPRNPKDTMYHHGSAGVNPLGAHARGVTKVEAKKRHPAVDALRKHRIVSGSFGSFEGAQPNKFEERTYRLMTPEDKLKEKKK